MMDKLLGAVALVLGVVLLGAVIGPDYAYLGTYYSMAGAFASLAYLLWPARHNPLARGTFCIALFATGIVTFLALHVTLGRPEWWIKSFPFLVFLTFAGGLLASVSYLIITIGHIHQRTPLHVSIVCAIIAVGFTLSWYLAP